ncbi:MMD [Lepeophtheirus salmonis]|uniref:MMD n=1 Tax=Lepeophtheirus salmonis TaxID=72036 RepID=A0A7R8D4I0_LEPSM|nr:MMD [Lepeophtheirus salmonis]CAF2972864.1 MMD [Lepeophtheirus salmonis]
MILSVELGCLIREFETPSITTKQKINEIIVYDKDEMRKNEREIKRRRIVKVRLRDRSKHRIFFSVLAPFVEAIDVDSYQGLREEYRRRVTNSYFTLDFLQSIKWKNEKPLDNRAYVPTNVEHIANIITHGFFILPVIWLSHNLISLSSSSAQYWAFVVYGVVLVGLFSVSTLFHLVSFTFHNGQLRDILHRGDRAMIYLFIAGSYTPWLNLRIFPAGSWSEELQWLTWVLAFLGILYQQLFHEKYKLIETLMYVFVALTPSLSVLEMAEIDGVFELQVCGIIYLGPLFISTQCQLIWRVLMRTLKRMRS